MRTEQQLRDALSSLESQAPSRDRVMPDLAPRWRAPRKGRLYTTAITVAVATAVAVALIVAPARTPARQVLRAVPLRTALLTAFQSAAGDIVYSKTWRWGAYDPKDGFWLADTEWQVPFAVEPGQTVHTRSVIPGAPDHPAVFQDSSDTYVQPHGGKTSAVTEEVVVDYQSHTWTQAPGVVDLLLGSDLSTLREQVAKGQYKLVGHPVLDGQQTIELRSGWVDRSPHIRAWATTLFWVNASTYLPVQGVTREGSIGNPKTDLVLRYEYRFLPPTPANMRQLQSPIPPGFKRVPATLPDGTKQKLPAGTR